jgi:ATP-dependent DNA helicase MPH1
MPSTDEEDYGDIADEFFIEAFSQASQTLPPYPHDLDNETHLRDRSRTESGVSGDDEDRNGKARKKKYRIHTSVREVPPAQVIGATQAEDLPDSSPYRIRGPIFKKPRLDPVEPQIVPNPPLFSTTFKRAASSAALFQPDTPGRLQRDEEFACELDGLPSDAFSSPEDRTVSKEPISIGSSPPVLPPASISSSFLRRQVVGSQNGLHQTTLFGGRAPDDASASQARTTYNFKMDKPPEAPTHHSLDQEALKTWVYPMNLGDTRDYQYTIVRNALFNNLLVALPTGLGKTFIAATVMLNYFRWTKNAQIIFVAPTKPLVAQQVDACFNIVGLPRSATTMLTGEQVPALRVEEWETKRVFFMTPQTLLNDLSTGIADPKKIVLLVVDEAHRATGEYAYVKVVQFIRRFNTSFRILALTATPGSTVEAVQEVIDALEIAKVEIRTEDSIDIREFVHQRHIDQVLLDPSDEIIEVKELLSKALQPLVNLLCSQNAHWNKDPMALTAYGLIKAKKAWFMSDAGRRANYGIKGMMNSLFTVLASIAHAIKLLNFHGIGPFYATVQDFRLETEDGNKGGKYKAQIVQSPHFKKMMDKLQFWLSKPDFVSHPKTTYLCDTILNHFLDAGDGSLADDAPPSDTRVIVFSEYRESAEDIARALNRHAPLIKASVFVGQADSKRSEGMNQAKQLETIQKFKTGQFNVIVATSIGEEGLDIGQVDLIVCYDASGSPIRMLQRMGRTGRKRAGNIVLLLMRGKEAENFARAKDNYEQMQKMISNGSRFSFRHDLSTRIIPRDITPVVDKRLIDIPAENTQNPSLPEPKRRRPTKPRKKPAKKFHMPDGVETGFRRASKLDGGGALTASGVTVLPNKSSEAELEPIPPLESVLLRPEEMNELERRFQSVAGSDLQEVEMPSMTSQTIAQRSLLPTINVPHGKYTEKCVRVFKLLASSQHIEERYERRFGDAEPVEISWSVPPLVEDESDTVDLLSQTKKAALVSPKRSLPASANESDSDQTTGNVANRRKSRRRPISYSAAESDSEEDETRSHAALVESDGEGDDLADSEQRSEDDSDLGSLKDFLAGSSSPVTKRKVPSTRSSSPPSRSNCQAYELSRVTATQDTNDDMPDIAEIIGMKARAISRTLIEDSDGDNLEPMAGRRDRRRKVIEDDSDY